MKITKSQLKRVIKEELQVVLKEGAVPCEPDHNYVKVELFPTTGQRFEKCRWAVIYSVGKGINNETNHLTA